MYLTSEARIFIYKQKFWSGWGWVSITRIMRAKKRAGKEKSQLWLNNAGLPKRMAGLPGKMPACLD